MHRRGSAIRLVVEPDHHVNGIPARPARPGAAGAGGVRKDVSRTARAGDRSPRNDSLARSKPFASVDYLTVRDDAPADVKTAATEHFRRTVDRRTAEGKRVLIVPVVLSFGGIEKGIAARLDGLAYTMADRGLLPDDRLIAWILEMAR